MKALILSLLFTMTAAAAPQRILTADQIEGIATTKNYLGSKGHFEKNANGWSAYADAAGAMPVDATGGSPSVTCTRTTSSPLAGDGSFLVTKGATNRQGDGCSTSFSIDAKDKSKVLQIDFDFVVASGSFVDGDLTVYIYDVTNAAVIQPDVFSMASTSTGLHQKATFQAASNSTSYRLAFHVASTSSSAYTVKIDDIKLAPQTVQDIDAKNASFSVYGSTTSLSAGSGVDISYPTVITDTQGGYSAGVYTPKVPGYYDFSMYAVANGGSWTSGDRFIGYLSVTHNGSTNAYEFCRANVNVTGTQFPNCTGSINGIQLYVGDTVKTQILSDRSVNLAGGNFSGARHSGSSSGSASESVIFRAFKTGSQTPSGDTLISFSSGDVTKDSSGGFDDASDKWCTPISGQYRIYGSALAPAGTAGSTLEYAIDGGSSVVLRDGVQTAGTATTFNGSDTVTLLASQCVQMKVNSSGSWSNFKLIVERVGNY